jgi:hypothetical protein
VAGREIEECDGWWVEVNVKSVLEGDVRLGMTITSSLL